MFEIQDVAGANIYPSEYILLAGIFDRPPSPHGWHQLPPDRFFISAAPRYMCSLCDVFKTVEGEAAYFHMSIPDLPRPQGGSGAFLLFVSFTGLFYTDLPIPKVWIGGEK